MDSISGFGELSELDRVELHMLYGACVADVELFTRQQWWAGAYALALYALLLLTGHQLGGTLADNTAWHAWVLVGLTWAVGLYGVIAIKRMQNAIVVGRRRLDRVRSSFGRAFQEVWSMPRPREDIHHLLYGVLILGAALVTWMALDRVYGVVVPPVV